MPDVAAERDEAYTALRYIARRAELALPPATHCPVCLRVVPLEEHHLAPRALFGDEAERWSTQNVCRDCHERWHAFMGHPIGGCAVPGETLQRLAELLVRHGYTVTVRASGAA